MNNMHMYMYMYTVLILTKLESELKFSAISPIIFSINERFLFQLTDLTHSSKLHVMQHSTCKWTTIRF